MNSIHYLNFTLQGIQFVFTGAEFGLFSPKRNFFKMMHNFQILQLTLEVSLISVKKIPILRKRPYSQNTWIKPCIGKPLNLELELLDM